MVLEDEGATVAIAERVARGEILYRDAPINLGPGVYLLFGALFRVCGTSYVGARLLVSMASLATALLLLGLARRCGAGAFALLAPWLFLILRPFAFPSWHMAIYNPMATALALLAFYLSLARKWPLAAGVAAGVAALCKQNYGALALLLCLAIFCSRSTRRRRNLVRAIAGFSLPLLLTCGYFLLAGAMRPFFRMTVLFPLTAQANLFHVSMPALLPLFSPDEAFRASLLYRLPPLVWESIFPAIARSEVWRNTGLVELFLKGIFYLPFLLAGFVAIRPGRDRIVERRLAALASIGFLLLGCYPSFDFAHLSYAMPPVFVCAAVMARCLLNSRSMKALLLLGMGIVSILTLLFACHALALYRTRLPRTGLDVPASRGAPLLAAASYLESHGIEKVIVMPYQPGFYHLSGTQNPTRADIFIPSFVSPEETGRVLEELRAGTPAVLFSKEYAHLPRFLSSFPKFAPYLSGTKAATFRGDEFSIRIFRNTDASDARADRLPAAAASGKESP